MASDWTDARVATLIELYADPKNTYSDIAAVLGVSRNACIGKALRLGFAPRGVFVNKERKPRPRKVKIATPPPVVSPPVPRRAPVIRCDPVPAGSVTLFAVRASQCRWPLGDPKDVESFRFCGARIDAGSYCRAHGSIAYRRVA